ncbi:MAG: response regulator, partial [Gemmatimonadales bacterium]|nr:response regulator [Gemmatimonadales bacterium]
MPRVLVAEDEMLLALTLRQQLEHRGYEVVAIA